MKKRQLLALGLATAMAASMVAGCGSSSETPADSSAEAATGDEATAPSETPSAGGGKVYYLNFKPEANQAWQDLAAEYTAQTGVEVNVLTAADGQYDTTLQSEMAKSEAPTIFIIGSNDDAKTWDNYTYDLSGSAIFEHLTDKSLVVGTDSKTAGVASCYECYGLIYNKTILEGYCGMEGAVVSSVDEINSFETLKAVVEDINGRIDEINDELGTFLTGAIASSGLDSGSSWRFSGHLAGLPLYYEFLDDGCDLVAGEESIDGTYLDQFKAVWDMYVANSSADPKTLESGALNGEAEFGMCEAVFYQNGDWEYSSLTNPENGYEVTADDIGMMPIYFGVDDENEGLAVGTENYWAVNSQASAEDIQASLDFLEWVITSDEGRDAITNAMGLTAPFDTFEGEFATSNVLAQAANEYAAAGKTSVAWSFNATPNVDDWRADVVAALTAYTKGSGDWDAVVTAFVDGWAEQWALAHEE